MQTARFVSRRAASARAQEGAGSGVSCFFSLPALALLAAAMLAPAAAEAHEPVLVRMLSAFDGGPPNEALDRFEPGLEEQLIAIIGDDEIPRLARQRAVHALSRYSESDRSFDLLVSIASEGDPVLRLTAMGAAVKGFAKREGTVALLRSTLGDPDAGLRARAVRLLDHLGGPQVEEILARHRLMERHVVVRRALRDALKQRPDRPLPREGVMREPSSPRAEDALSSPDGASAEIEDGGIR